MAASLNYYSQLADQQTGRITSGRENWTTFLDAAARLYKYPFPEQLMIFAQRPDATACAPFETWTKTMKSFVRRGSKGIALIDDSGNRPRLKYVFDISDTGMVSKENSRRPVLWEMKPEHEAPITNALKNAYGDRDGDIKNLIYDIAAELAEDCYNNNTDEIYSALEGSYLQNVDAFMAGETFREALTISTAYSIMSRCGLNPSDYFEDEEWGCVFDFNTPQSVYALGTATSNLSEQVLREIEVAVKKYEREKSVERNNQHGQQSHLQRERGLSSSRSETDGTTAIDNREIQFNEEKPSQTTQDHNLQHTALDREVVPTPDGDRTISQQSDGIADETTTGKKSAAQQSDITDGVGAAHGELENASGGNNFDGANIPLSDEVDETIHTEGVVENTALFSMAEPNDETETTVRTIKTISELLERTNIPLETVDALLRDGGNQKNSPLRIAAYFMKDKSLEDNADFLKREFEKGGKGFSINGQKVSAWFDGRGITIGEGPTAINAPDKVHLSWEQIAVRVRELLDTGQFLPQPELNKALDNERHEIASRLWFFYRDGVVANSISLRPSYVGHPLHSVAPPFPTKSADSVGTPSDFPQAWDSKRGYPEDVERIKYLLEQPEQLAEIVSNLEKDVGILRQASPRRKIWSDPEQLLSDAKDCLLESITFEAVEEIQSNGTQFITEDEIETFLSEGSKTESGKYRIFSYFLNERSSREKADFLKDEYGTGGGTHALSRADNSYEDHSSKGIKLSRGDIFVPYDTVELSWSDVAKRIETQIKQGRYMTRPELERIPSYEKEQLARDINSFFYNVPDEYARPYPQGAYFTDGIEKIRAMLEDTEQVAVLIDMMKPIIEITPDVDKNYNIRQSAYNNLLDYKDGEYNLFPNLPEDMLTESMIANRRPSDIPKEPEPLPEPPPMFPTLEEQLATLAQVEQQEDLSPVTIEQSDIDNAIINWNGNLDSKIAVYEYMHENARARETANFLRDQYGNNLKVFTVTKEGAEAVTLPWAKVQRRIAQLMDDNRFLTPTEKEKAHVALENIRNDLASKNTESEVTMVDDSVFTTAIISDVEIDSMLIQAIENPATKEDVKRQFNENPRSREVTTMLKTVYTNINYATSRTDGINGYMGLVSDKNGVTITKGDPSSIPFSEQKPPLSITLNWMEIQKRITDLVAEGRFVEVPTQTTPALSTMPITRSIIDTFSKADHIAYAKTSDGFLFATNGQFMIKTTEQDFNDLMTRVNSRKRKNKIEATENTRILDYVENTKGTFELTGKPYEEEDRYHNKSYIYADNKQYFQYKKDYVDVFEGNRLLVNDNASYDTNSHHLVVKNSNNELLGIVLPITVFDEDYERLANILPLEIPRKSEIERIKENPTNDPYIGRDFFDGTDNMIISGIQKINGKDKYVVPTIRNGELSRSAVLINVDEIETAINRWESNRIYREQQDAEAEIKAQKEAEIRAEYEDTNGYTDNMPPMQKANALKALNESFYTKDYGRLNVKQFIFTAVQEGKTLELHRCLKKKYAEMSDRGYIQELNWRERSDVLPRYRVALDDGVDSPGAEWLKEQHPFLHYALFHDESVLDNSYFNTEYRVMLDDSRFYNVTKTAYDYGNYLIDNNITKQQRQDETINNEVSEQPISATEASISSTVSASEQPLTNFRITDDHLGEGGAKTKYSYNIEAIRLLKTIESENRLATPEEQKILSRYVGWGGIPQAFDERNDGWKREYSELKELLTPDEYSMARASSLNAHYTSPTVIKAIYETVERMGFKGGNVLEPACGIGNFFGLLPESMQGSKLYGVELDSISGRIAKQLYQKADITISGYEKTDKPDAFFDLTIGNVPFGDYKVSDKRYDNHNFHIHDYFMAKALDQTRPGGIMAFVTSKYTLDKANPTVRKYLAQRAELLGAVRLPNDAFLKNAGTETTTDIIFMKKRDRLIDIEPEWVHLNQLTIDDGQLTIPVNSYFVDNPQMILGTMGLDKRMNDKYGRSDLTTCYSVPGADLAEQLKTALANIQGEISEPNLDDIGEAKDESIAADPTVKNFSFALVTPREENGQWYAGKVGEGDVYYRENSRMYPVNLPTSTLERIKGMIALRECVNTLMDYQLNEYSDEAIAEKQAELNALYDSFTNEFGLINSRGNSTAFSSDNSYFLLASLEILDENGKLERKADMFSKRTIKQNTVVTSVDTSSEALAVSIAERAKVDIDFMVELTGFSEEKIIKDLEGVIFHDFGNPNRTLPDFDPDIMKLREKYPLVTADEYLSGNVREKLRKALDFNEVNGDIFQGINTTVNIEALKTVQPKDLEASEIGVRLGSTWIHRDYIQQFITELLRPPYPLSNLINVNYSEHTGEWNVDKRGRCPSSNVLACVTYGTGRMNAYEIIHETLNLKDVRVFDYVKDDEGKDKRVLNKDETTKALQKQEQIKQAFKDWIWKEPERRHELVTLYNERFNNNRPREYDGSHLTMGGMTPNITLRTHQRDAIARVLYGGNTLLAHEVGAGKTFEMIGAAMESKRLGLCNKSLFAVPNHLTEQIASDFLRMYPSANILVAREKDFEPKSRKKFCAKIATGDYDAVILGHSQFEKIPISRERQVRHLNEQIDEITDGIADLMRNDEAHFSVKQLEKTRKSLEARLEKLLDPKRKDDVVSFEQLGVDRLFVDESHHYKNLFLHTKMRNVAGLSTAEAQKSSDMFMKCRYLDEITDNKGIIFATGTPLTNSMTEMYTLQRYLQYDILQQSRLGHFDSWASTFGETVTALELAPEGKGYRARTRFARFHNLPELMDMFKNVADIKTADMIAADDIPRPKANFQTIAVKPSEIQQELVADLSDRAAKVHNRQVEPNIDNMLKITSDGRKIGLDQRLMNDMLPDDPNSKVNACMENVFSIWNETASERLTQIIFCDFSTPNTDGRFNVYDDIKDKLLAKGVPKEEIAFIHDYNTKAQKKELFAKVRSGQIRVLFGSTFKLGTGTNVQDRIIAQHDLDCPWRPGDLEQRTGRSVRQGNINKEVTIYRYVTESTFDAYLWVRHEVVWLNVWHTKV